MSYCRFSSDDYQCDVYVYESESGFATHVANMRRVFKEPFPPPVEMSLQNIDQYVARNQKILKMCEQSDLVKIQLPHAGGDFLHQTPGECADWLETLRNTGFRVPQYAIDSLREEQQEYKP